MRLNLAGETSTLLRLKIKAAFRRVSERGVVKRPMSGQAQLMSS